MYQTLRVVVSDFIIAGLHLVTTLVLMTKAIMLRKEEFMLLLVDIMRNILFTGCIGRCKLSANKGQSGYSTATPTGLLQARSPKNLTGQLQCRSST